MANNVPREQEVNNFLTYLDNEFINNDIPLDDVLGQMDFFTSQLDEVWGTDHAKAGEPKYKYPEYLIKATHAHFNQRISDIAMGMSSIQSGPERDNIRKSNLGEYRFGDRRIYTLHTSIPDRELYDLAFVMSSHISYLKDKVGVDYHVFDGIMNFKDEVKGKRYQKFLLDTDEAKMDLKESEFNLQDAEARAWEETSIGAGIYDIPTLGSLISPFSATGGGAYRYLAGNIAHDSWQAPEETEFDYWDQFPRYTGEGTWPFREKEYGMPDYVADARGVTRKARANWLATKDEFKDLIDLKVRDVEKTLDANRNYYRGISSGVENINVWEYVVNNHAFLLEQYHKAAESDKPDKDNELGHNKYYSKFDREGYFPFQEHALTPEGSIIGNYYGGSEVFPTNYYDKHYEKYSGTISYGTSQMTGKVKPTIVLDPYDDEYSFASWKNQWEPK